MILHDLPPLIFVYQHTRRWLEAGSFGALVADLRLLLRLHAGRQGQPSAVILDSRVLTSTPESGRARPALGAAGYLRQRAKSCAARSSGAGHSAGDRGSASRWPLSTKATPAPHPLSPQRRRVLTCLWSSSPPPARQGFVLLPKRWVVERSYAWVSRFRRLAVRYERRADIHQAFLSLGCSLICWQTLNR